MTVQHPRSTVVSRRRGDLAGVEVQHLARAAPFNGYAHLCRITQTLEDFHALCRIIKCDAVNFRDEVPGTQTQAQKLLSVSAWETFQDRIRCRIGSLGLLSHQRLNASAKRL